MCKSEGTVVGHDRVDGEQGLSRERRHSSQLHTTTQDICNSILKNGLPYYVSCKWMSKI
jgi:hypothetical protein